MDNFQRLRLNQRTRIGNSITIELMVVFCLLVSLGFPGSYTSVYGEKISTLAEYAAFIMQIGMILATSASDWKGIELIHLEKKYYILYLYVAFIFAESMLVTSSRSSQMITCLRLVVTLLFVIWMQNRFSMEQILDLFYIAQGIFILFTILLMVRHPHLAFESSSSFTNALCGLFKTKNNCASELVFGIIISVFSIQNKMRKKALPLWMPVLFFVHCLLLALCQATGAVITAVVIFIPIIFFKKQRLKIGLIYIAANVMFLFSMLTLMPLFEGIIIAMGKDPSLTGRIPMWKHMINVMMNHNTMLGFGYSMFWRDVHAVNLIHSAYSMRKSPFMAMMTSGGHNVLMEMWLNSGLLGIAAFFITILYSFRDLREMEEGSYRFCVAVMAYLTLNGFTERCLGGNFDYNIMSLFLTMTLGCRYAPVRNRRIRQTQIDSGNSVPPLGE